MKKSRIRMKSSLVGLLFLGNVWLSPVVFYPVAVMCEGRQPVHQTLCAACRERLEAAQLHCKRQEGRDCTCPAPHVFCLAQNPGWH